MKVCIEKDDQGQFTVGIDSGDQEAGGMGGGAMGPRMMAGGEPIDGQGGMQPVADIEAALSTARDLLSGGTGVQTQEAMDGQTWNRAKAARQMQKQPGGPMMGKMG